MTLTHGTDRLESDRLVLRRIGSRPLSRAMSSSRSAIWPSCARKMER